MPSDDQQPLAELLERAQRRGVILEGHLRNGLMILVLPDRRWVLDLVSARRLLLGLLDAAFSLP